ncbi:MAG TPA: hypothetical protein VI112_00990 [Bacteroidia bacterium]|jgi:hypothetical protein
MNAQWIFFDVPYAEDASKMRGILGYSNGSGTDCHFTYPCKDVPDAIAQLEKIAADNGISMGKEMLLVYPLDMRHGLAWAVKENADKKGWGFSRHIPAGQYPDPNKLILYSHFDNGSSEMTLDKPSASLRIIELQGEALDEMSDGDMLPVMGILRHALSLSVTHEGWVNSDTLMTLYLLLNAFARTGNPDNINEGHFLVKQALMAITSRLPGPGTPGNDRLAANLDKIAAAVENNDDVPLGMIVRSTAMMLGV